MKAVAFAPGHITGFFEICTDDNNEVVGSRGAGVCISLGSYACAERTDAPLTIHGNVGKGEVTRKALQMITGKGISVMLKNELPISQGFSVSASSSLAATLSAAVVLGIPERKALEATHAAELGERTGLGDAVASFTGGMEIRKQPGIEGEIEKVPSRKRLLIAVVDREIRTRDILSSDAAIERINEVGRECLDTFMRNKSVEHLLDVSLDFSLRSGLADERMKRVLMEARRIGRISLCMLGRSLFAIYSREMKKFFSRYEHYECVIDNEGARVLATLFP